MALHMIEWHVFHATRVVPRAQARPCESRDFFILGGEEMIRIFDTTLRDGEQSPGCSMHLNEKIQMAKQLERMGVDIIEAGFAIASKGDFESISEVAKAVKDSTVASLARCLPKDIDAAYEAVRHAESPMLHVFLATSPIHMKYKLEMKEDEVYERAVESVRYARKFCSNIEFSCEDASRSELPFLYRIIEGVIDAGATTVNIPDTVGYTTPQEFEAFIRAIRENTPNIDKAVISVHCHNDLGMGVANSLSAVLAGAGQIECTVNGIGERAGNAALEEVVMALQTRKDFYQKETRIRSTEIMRSSHLLSSITGVRVQPHKAIVGINAFAHESGIHQHGMLKEKSTYEIMTPESVGLQKNMMVLGKHSGKHALRDRLADLGYEIDNAELEALFVKFKALADEKKTVYDKDIEALLIGQYSQVEDGYELVDYQTATSEGKDAKTIIQVSYQDERIERVGTGKGPIDAAFDAMAQITGEDVRLQDFSIHAVTQGKDAIGETLVKIEKDGRMYSGKGMSTDIIKSSILAYMNAINHMESRRKRGLNGNTV